MRGAPGIRRSTCIPTWYEKIHSREMKASRKKINFRHIIYRDPISNRLFDFITNDRDPH